MLATICKRVRFKRAAHLLLLAAGAAALASCATKEQPPLITDSASTRESQLPWNKQEKWESSGQLGPMADRFSGSGR